MTENFDRRGSAGVYLILVIQSLTASGTHLIAKVIVQAVDPFSLTLVRSLIALVGMTIVLLVRGRWFHLRREDWGLVLGLSFLAIPVNQFLFLYGMRFTTPSNAALLYATTPILVLLFSHWFLAEPLTRRKIHGVMLGFLGVTVVIFERGVDASMQFVYGNLIIFVAVNAWGLYTVYGKKLIARYGPIEASAATLFVGTLLFLPFGVLPALSFPFETLTPANWVQIAYLGLVTSVVAYLLWYFALARIEAAKVALFTNLQPILTTVLAVILLGQGITVLFVVGGLLAIGGVILAQFG
jgi:drug/metabolite transporter (DMT)-like permease